MSASRPDAAPWCDWARDRVTDLVNASATWPAPLPTDDDGRVELACQQLLRATRALDNRIRRRAAETPPAPPPPPEPPEPDTELLAHRELLDQARPFGRVTTRPYDPELRRRLAEATAYAATFAPTWSNLSIGLEATAELAVAVAGNASPDELRRLAAQDWARRPLCAGILLVAELARRAADRGHDDVVQELRTSLVELFETTDWADEATWAGSELYGATMLGLTAAVTSTDAVRSTLAAALRTAPQRAPVMLLSCAAWTETRDSRHREVVLGGKRVYVTCPDWLPGSELLAAYESTTAPPDRTPELARLIALLEPHCR